MKRRNEQTIGEVLRQYLKMTQVENLVYVDRIAALWQETLGDDAARETERIHLQSGHLFVTLRSPALKNDLMMRRSAIARALNERLGSDVVQCVVIR